MWPHESHHLSLHYTRAAVGSLDPEKAGNIIPALDVIGWISIVMAVVLTVYRLPNLTTGIGEAISVLVWASLFGAAFGGSCSSPLPLCWDGGGHLGDFVRRASETEIGGGSGEIACLTTSPFSPKNNSI